jgi:hypothetical protein
MTTFAAHGEYTIRRCGRVVRVDAWGPWNLERTVDYTRSLRACMHSMPKPFGMLMISNVQPILSPESETVLLQNVRERVWLGCNAQATVLLDVATIDVAMLQYEHIYKTAGLRHVLFDEIAPAVQWLIDNGYSDAKGLRLPESRTEVRELLRREA